ncbi:NAD(P)-dependent oxidoreductase [Thiohalorhabdus sp. Cl-TMA]|uniref:NAD(P)-dependent oxidoreductase n=1 Tax=Thiohalorhabdus methylotrophus TaxID=3242694 RepID=A0ABV4TTT9_9GAMM
MHIALIGTGLMGEPLARRLLEGGHRVTIWNRSPEKTRALAEEGAVVADHAHEALEDADWVVTMLANADAMQSVLLNNQARPMLAGRKVLNMATIAPHEARQLQEQVEAAGGTFMECTVLGSIPEAKSGSLILMFGGTEAQFEEAAPLLDAFGPKPLHIGEVGKAAALKLAMNQLIAGLTTSFALSLGLVRREGLDVEQFMEVVRDSALYAPTFDKKLNRMLEGHFDNPNFPVAHLLKDVYLMEDAARKDGLDGTLMQTIGRLLEKAEMEGLDQSDYSALYKVIDPDHA